jgi:hypothetical protein
MRSSIERPDTQASEIGNRRETCQTIASCDTRTEPERHASIAAAMTEAEKNLVAGCLKGHKTSWDAFVVQYSALVYHAVRKTLALHSANPSTKSSKTSTRNFFSLSCAMI